MRLLMLALALSASVTSFDDPATRVDAGCRPTAIAFSVNGRAAPLVTARSGDHVAVSFDVPKGCESRFTLASFVAGQPAFDGTRLAQQALFRKDTEVYGPGRHTLEVEVFEFPRGPVQDCSAARVTDGVAVAELRTAVRLRMALSAGFQKHVEEAVVKEAEARRGANQHGPYDSTCDGSPSQNGSGDGQATGRPCAGCVGNADDKNPPGQGTGGDDPNAGYECDRNHGVGRGNPAHSGCENFQVDFSYHPADEPAHGDHHHDNGLVAGLFCVRSTAQCYVTDRTGDRAATGA
jgi:hypothetical protein